MLLTAFFYFICSWREFTVWEKLSYIQLQNYYGRSFQFDKFYVLGLKLPSYFSNLYIGRRIQTESFKKMEKFRFEVHLYI